MFTKPKTEAKNTISQEEYERRLKELQDEIEELKKIKVEEPKNEGIWKPKTKDRYYYNYAGSTSSANHTDTHIDNNRLYDYNFYKTKEEAEYRYAVNRYTEMFRRYVEEHSEQLNWDDDLQEKWCIYWSYRNECIGFCSNFYGKYQGIIYANSKAVLEDAIEFVGRDNVIKYVLGVKNA